MCVGVCVGGGSSDMPLQGCLVGCTAALGEHQHDPPQPDEVELPSHALGGTKEMSNPV